MKYAEIYCLKLTTKSPWVMSTKGAILYELRNNSDFVMHHFSVSLMMICSLFTAVERIL